MSYHDKSNNAFRWLEFAVKESDPLCYEWVGISQKLPILQIHLDFLKKVLVFVVLSFTDLRSAGRIKQ